MCGEQGARGWKWVPSGESGKLCRGGVEVTACAQRGNLAKCFGKVSRREANSVLEGTRVQNLGWDKRMPQGPVSF